MNLIVNVRSDPHPVVIHVPVTWPLLTLMEQFIKPLDTHLWSIIITQSVYLNTGLDGLLSTVLWLFTVYWLYSAMLSWVFWSKAFREKTRVSLHPHAIIVHSLHGTSAWSISSLLLHEVIYGYCNPSMLCFSLHSVMECWWLNRLLVLESK